MFGKIFGGEKAVDPAKETKANVNEGQVEKGEDILANVENLLNACKGSAAIRVEEEKNSYEQREEIKNILGNSDLSAAIAENYVSGQL